MRYGGFIIIICYKVNTKKKKKIIFLLFRKREGPSHTITFTRNGDRIIEASAALHYGTPSKRAILSTPIDL